MPNTSSYIINGTEYKNKQCFAEATTAITKGKDVIIVVEKNKYYKNLSKTITYIRDLMEIGLPITKYKVNKRGKVEIYLKKESKRSLYIFTFMSIRYMWEGKVVDCSDNFFEILNYYFRIRNNKKYNKLQLLLISFNLYLINKAKRGMNSNHCYSNFNGCKIIDDISKMDNIGVNHFFSEHSLEKITKLIKMFVPFKYITNTKIEKVYESFKK